MKLSNRSLKEFWRTVCAYVHVCVRARIPSMCICVCTGSHKCVVFVPQSLQADWCSLGLPWPYYTSNLWPLLLWLPRTHIVLVIEHIEQHPGVCHAELSTHSVKCRCKWGQKGCVGYEFVVRLLKIKLSLKHSNFHDAGWIKCLYLVLNVLLHLDSFTGLLWKWARSPRETTG